MFSILNLPFDRLLPRFGEVFAWRRRLAMHQNALDLEEMPESFRRDLGLLDGRDRRGPQDQGAFRAARLIYTQRSL